MSRRDEDLNAELQSHLDQSVRDRMDRGQSRADAESAARREFGNLLLVKEVTREMWGWASIERLWQDLRYGLRMLRKSPAFTAVAILTLALGIGANAAMFSVVYGVLLRPLPFPDADRIAVVYLHFSPQNNPRGNMSPPVFFDWREQNQSFEQVGAFTNNRVQLTGVGEAEQIFNASVTANFFSILGQQPLLGRTFLDGEDTGSSPRLAIVSETLWRQRFSADSNIVGKVILLDGEPTTVIGVMPADFQYPRQTTLMWTNLRLPPTRHGPFFLNGLARLKPGVSMQQAQAETNAIGARIEKASPGTFSRLTMPVWPLRDALVGNVRPALLMMFGAVGFVLLIAMVNVANLVLSRSAVRRREMAVRIGLGATRGRLLRQLLTESVVLGLLGAAVGLFFAFTALQAFRAWNPTSLLPRVASVRLDATVVLFTVVLAVATGILFGVVPALRISAGDFHLALKEGGRGANLSSTGQRTHSILAVSEIALSLVLVAGAGLLLRSLIQLQRVETGIGAPLSQVYGVHLSLTGAKNRDPKLGLAFYRRVLEGVRALPGVDAAGTGDLRLPDMWSDDDTFNIEGKPWTEESYPSTVSATVSPGYLEALQVPLLRGRAFTEQDRADSPGVAIISESLARRYFPGEDPIGHRMQQSQPGIPENPWMEIVGVVGDVKYRGLDNPAAAMAYYKPLSQNYGGSAFLYVRSSRDAAALAPQIERVVHGIDPDCVLTFSATLQDSVYSSVSQPRFRAVLIGAFAAIALLLAAIGVYGVISYSVAQRTQEFGVRMALGARPADVLRLVLGKGFALAAAGVGCGLLASLLLMRTLSRFLFQVSAADPLTFSAVALLLGGVAILAGYLPARRAVRVDPTVALRYE